jgi:hypothetical protein
MRFFFVVALSLAIVACANTPEPQTAETAKTLPDSHYTEDEEAAYKEKFQKSDDDILYYFIIDSDGTVANSILIDWKRDMHSREFATEFKKITNAMTFEKAAPGTPRYREGFFPVKVCELMPYAAYCQEAM